ncbi:DUF2971 domain-containing protein [Acinetobacter calcoaceticus]|uniref:DUF2971 domain-containing protein n=1 Tax=Acinetobacter calcoaceticus TaxID=471 RepID=UPI003F7C2608
MNLLYKYYRSNIFFEKAIRYNEIYFSENNELNDPHDLKVNFKFDDNPNLWKEVLALPTQFQNRVFPDWNLNLHFDIENPKLLQGINNIFKEKIIDTQASTLNNLLEDQKEEIKNLFKDFKLESKTNTFQGIDSLDLLSTFLKEKLTQATNINLYSASFSANPLNPLMWAHYADGFKGCVVIYKTTSNYDFYLKNHYESKEFQPYKFEKVTYKDGDKNISLLESALKKERILINACIQKSNFWEYEDEYRLLTSITLESLLKANSPEEITPIRERIMYHDPRMILGVIFGPRCTAKFKQKIELTLRDNRIYCNNDFNPQFFLFDTNLTTEGKIKITRAKENIHRDSLMRKYENLELDKLLSDLKIVEKK